jgi:hypothetical protein
MAERSPRPATPDQDKVDERDEKIAYLVNLFHQETPAAAADVAEGESRPASPDEYPLSKTSELSTSTKDSDDDDVAFGGPCRGRGIGRARRRLCRSTTFRGPTTTTRSRSGSRRRLTTTTMCTGATNSAIANIGTSTGVTNSAIASTGAITSRLLRTQDQSFHWNDSNLR